ncbi:terminase small subunit [Chloroflexota bacterium]
MPLLKNPRQERFCIEYIKTGNATQAATIAGYSRKTARSIACENLTKPYILARIRELQEQTTTAKVLSVVERKEILSKIMIAPLNPSSITASHVTQAADIINKMDRVYTEAAPKEGEVYNTFVFVLPDGTRLSPKLEVIEGEAINIPKNGRLID